MPPPTVPDPVATVPEVVAAPRRAAAEFVPHLVEHAPQGPEPRDLQPVAHVNGSPASGNGAPLAAPPATFPTPAIAIPSSGEHASISDPGIRPPGSCTPAQLRRFIKSRPWIPMHELRRRFAINGPDDEVTRVDVEGGCLFVGLPAREGQILGDLVRAGEVGYELSRDPTTPVIVGVYPMRPVPRL